MTNSPESQPARGGINVLAKQGGNSFDSDSTGRRPGSPVGLTIDALRSITKRRSSSASSAEQATTAEQPAEVDFHDPSTSGSSWHDDVTPSTPQKPPAGHVSRRPSLKGTEIFPETPPEPTPARHAANAPGTASVVATVGVLALLVGGALGFALANRVGDGPANSAVGVQPSQVRVADTELTDMPCSANKVIMFLSTTTPREADIMGDAGLIRELTVLRENAASFGASAESVHISRYDQTCAFARVNHVKTPDDRYSFVWAGPFDSVDSAKSWQKTMKLSDSDAVIHNTVNPG